MEDQLSTLNRSAGSPGSPSTTSSATATRSCCGSANRHPRCPAAGRAAAIRQQVLDMPAPIVAAALGYHHAATTARLAAEGGITWSRYAVGDHGKVARRSQQSVMG